MEINLTVRNIEQTVSFAGDELRRYLTRMLNAEEGVFSVSLAVEHREGPDAFLVDMDCSGGTIIGSNARSVLLGVYDYLRRLGTKVPILLLDDIFDRLDAARVEQIIRLVSSDTFGQIFITDVNRGHLDRLVSSATGDYKLYTVAEGKVELTNSSNPQA